MQLEILDGREEIFNEERREKIRKKYLMKDSI